MHNLRETWIVLGLHSLQTSSDLLLNSLASSMSENYQKIYVTNNYYLLKAKTNMIKEYRVSCYNITQLDKKKE